MPHTKAEAITVQPSKTPEIDDWCELAIHADISAVLNLAKSYEVKYHELQSENNKLKEQLLADKERGDKLVKLLTEYLAMPSIDGNIRRNELRHKLIQSMKAK